MLETIQDFVRTYIPLKIQITDIIEIIILSILFYEILVWTKRTRAWALFKGIVFLFIFYLVSYFLGLNTILWLIERIVSVGIIAIVVIFQPELRKALEQLGRKKFFSGMFKENSAESARFSDKTVSELVKAAYELGKTKTGALIVIEQEVTLSDFESTGIPIDAIITSQLLINIFEHNTPLHDGAVIVRGDRVVSATCYLPLSDNMDISKELGTRHRAAVGVSVVTDYFTIIVSEETGAVSVAIGGKIIRNIDGEKLRAHLIKIQNKKVDVKKFRLWKVKKQ